MIKCPFKVSGTCTIDCELYHEYCPYVDTEISLELENP